MTDVSPSLSLSIILSGLLREKEELMGITLYSTLLNWSFCSLRWSSWGLSVSRPTCCRITQFLMHSFCWPFPRTYSSHFEGLTWSGEPRAGGTPWPPGYLWRTRRYTGGLRATETLSTDLTLTDSKFIPITEPEPAIQILPEPEDRIERSLETQLGLTMTKGSLQKKKHFFLWQMSPLGGGFGAGPCHKKNHSLKIIFKQF